MDFLFYISAAVAIAATIMVVTRSNPIHALLYLIVSLLAVALVFFALGSPFVAALEVIIYAGAVMVLFVFVIMMLDLRRAEPPSGMFALRTWIGPAALAAVLLGELVWVYARSGLVQDTAASQSPQEVGAALYGTYALGVELMSLLLLAALVGAYHLARPQENLTRHHDAGGNP
ncbi:MAG: NADH-quinone oxidoreductase subunit J [Planctomycetaceae bacterium]|nr:NADH-quinone oxidoreductase subunit J [Planctomycetaceae bacterium]